MNLATLEQSQKLKAWGAPQSTAFTWIKGKSEEVWPSSVLFSVDQTIAAAYTLEELIDWLGGDFYYLSRYKGKWWAVKQGTRRSPDFEIEGANPLEAVFNLAEAIHGGKE